MNRLLLQEPSATTITERTFITRFLPESLPVPDTWRESNREHGEGRSDVAVYDSVNSRAVIFEAKYSRRKEDMEKEYDGQFIRSQNENIRQNLEEDYDSVLCYGISLYKKRCLIRE